MKSIRKSVLKAIILAALVCPAVYAGDMGSGGKTCPEGQTCLTGDMGSGGFTSYDSVTKRGGEGDMGSGGRTANNQGESYLESLLSSIYEYFDWAM